MFIWTVQDVIAGIMLVGAVIFFVGALIFAYGRYYWRKFFAKKVQ